MRKFYRVFLAVALTAAAFTLFVNSSKQKAEETPQQNTAGKIEQFELEKNGTGWARTAAVLWHTNDNGKNWQEITPPKSLDQRLSGISFIDENVGFVILANAQSFELARTNDGGNSWTKQNLNLSAEALAEANFNQVALKFNDANYGVILLRLTSSSNFTRAAIFSTNTGGAEWRLDGDFLEPGEYSLDKISLGHIKETQTVVARSNGKEFKFSENVENDFSFEIPLAESENISSLDFLYDAQNGWILAESGNCRGFKSDCEQSARILATSNGGKNWEDITPEATKAAVKLDDVSGLLLNSPGGSTRISINRGFDKCTAAPVSQMQTWWNESPFYDVNIYMSGRNRGCQQPQLTAAWVQQVSAQGWGLIPTIVGYQAPCLQACPNCARFSTDPVVAETQGRGEADIAITDATNLGLAQGTILYYDMERYDGDMVCRTAVNAFLKGWTDRLKEQGYKSGTYGSPTNAVADWVNIPEASRMDAVWMARWDNIPSTWFYASPSPQLPTNVWANQQRIKQYQAPANSTWGGITFNIDGNISGGPVAAVRPPKNKPADFDGDGKSDYAVFRADVGGWYWLNSGSGAFSAVNFGTAEDRIVPGDYDNDGRTDIAVFRPSNGTWYEYSFNPNRTNAGVNRSRQFGAAGDIPVAADYDGDGITDLAVFRGGNWFISNSFDPRTPNFRAEAWGAATDIPVPADYDGDGKVDIAVFRPETGAWFLLQSTAGYYAVAFGAPGDKPVQGDYDGDGKTDIGVFRPSTGGWYLLQSTAGFAGVIFGVSTDVPAPGDFDGDNKIDISVFRPENGTWYVLQSQSGSVSSTPFGANGDKPIETGYLP
jgi:photosystem II stability/assembly factor-like uncharacterized protein